MQKKILILMMSCNIPFFQEEEKLCKETWLKQIDNFDNIDYYIYTASPDDKYHIHQHQHKLYIPCNDSLKGTLEKTFKTLDLLLNQKILQDYDYIFRTNLSTYINIPLLNEFVQNITNDEITYASEIYITKETGPYKYGLFPLGNGMLLSKKLFNLLTFNTLYTFIKQYPEYDTRNCLIDDGAIGFILCSYYISQGKNIFDMFKEFGYVRPEFLHEPDPYYDNILDFPKCICISYRVFQNRSTEKEFNNCLYIHNIINEAKSLTDLSFINNWINKDKIHLVVTYLIDDIIDKPDAINILKYNKDFRKIPYIPYE